MPKLIRNLAISGVKTAGDMRLIENICEGANHKPQALLDTSEILYNLVYDNGDDDAFMYSWSSEDYDHCTLITMEQFRRKYANRPLQSKRRSYEDN